MGATKLLTAAGGGITLDAASTATDKTITVPADNGTMALTSQLNGFRNRIINGAMQIDQRNTGASVATTGAFPVDRFVQEFTGGGVLTSQQSADAPSGFTNSLKTTVTTVDSSIASGDYYQVTHNIEGYNIADFNLGSASASSFTVSFWVKASQTGTYSAQFANSDGSRCYPSTITVNTANTWEYKTIVVPATTSGTWLTTNGKGLSLRIGFVYGSSFNGATVNTWGTFSAFANSFATTTNNMMGTNGATFYITGVQLEKGSVATNFDYRPYGTELALCQRYYQQINGTGGYSFMGMAQANSSTSSRVGLSFQQPMRAQPSFSSSAAGTFTIANASGNLSLSAISLGASNLYGAWLSFTTGSTTTGYAGLLLDNGSSSAYLGFSSEL